MINGIFFNTQLKMQQKWPPRYRLPHIVEYGVALKKFIFPRSVYGRGLSGIGGRASISEFRTKTKRKIIRRIWEWAHNFQHFFCFEPFFDRKPIDSMKARTVVWFGIVIEEKM